MAGAAGFCKQCLAPHMMRRGGASWDALDNAPDSQIQARGRWSSLQSVLRYGKHGRYLRMLNSLSLRQTQMSKVCELWLKKHLRALLRQKEVKS